jgi:hypothetical protein
MSEKEIIAELRDVKKLLVAQLIVSGIQVGEIEELLELGEGNFSKSFRAGRLTRRIKQKVQKK